jgi:hypothetical protein
MSNTSPSDSEIIQENGKKEIELKLKILSLIGKEVQKLI